MQIKDKTTFKSGGFYNLTAQIQENTILNRGLLDIGGVAVPTIIMSNNKDERIERAAMNTLYFVGSFMAPFVLLPFFNKTFLRNNEIVKDFANNEKRIIEVSKKYLKGTVGEMVKGITDTGKELKCEGEFNKILKEFEGKEKTLKDKLLKTHEKILFSDFLATSLMWCSTPWLATGFTKLRTKRSGFSATYGMIDEKQSKLNAEKQEREKKKNLLKSALISIIPAIIFPKLVTKGFKNDTGILSSIVKKYAENLNYNKGIFPSKTIFAAIWILCDYPSALVSARDKYERKDRAVRSLGLFTVFFGGDFILNNIFGRLLDNFPKVQIMDDAKVGKKDGFFKKMLMTPKSFSQINNIKDAEILKRTKNVGAGLYWLTLVANMGLLGFALPAVMNRVLKNTLKKDMAEQKDNMHKFELKNDSKVFEEFKRVK